MPNRSCFLGRIDSQLLPVSKSNLEVPSSELCKGEWPLRQRVSSFASLVASRARHNRVSAAGGTSLCIVVSREWPFSCRGYPSLATDPDDLIHNHGCLSLHFLIFGLPY